MMLDGWMDGTYVNERGKDRGAYRGHACTTTTMLGCYCDSHVLFLIFLKYSDILISHTYNLRLLSCHIGFIRIYRSCSIQTPSPRPMADIRLF